MALQPLVTADTGLRYDTESLTPISRRNAREGLVATPRQMDVGDPVQGDNQFRFHIQENIEVIIPSAPGNPTCSVCPANDGRACRHIWRINDYILGRSYERTRPFRLSRPTGSTVTGFEEIDYEIRPLVISFYDVLFIFEAGDCVTSIFERFENWIDNGVVTAFPNSDVASTAAALRNQMDSIRRFMQHRGSRLPPSQRERIATVSLNIIEGALDQDQDYTTTVSWRQANFMNVPNFERNLFTNLIRDPAPGVERLSVVEALDTIREVFEVNDEDDDEEESDEDDDDEEEGNGLRTRIEEICEKLRLHNAPAGYINDLASLIDEE